MDFYVVGQLIDKEIISHMIIIFIDVREASDRVDELGSIHFNHLFVVTSLAVFLHDPKPLFH